ncbi:hypothetical protein ACQ9BO_07810 [Flavobacterium sp. P21]|uniref:hypothetical protein n=1 Tax=Flavobacterium sp. P21 TaxID=3423948 RepID=UPI003D670CAA
MKTTDVKIEEELKELAIKTFTTLKPEKYDKDRFIVCFTVLDYKDLFFAISNMIKLCVHALDEDFESDTLGISKINIIQILEIAIELLPMEEAEFLDKSRSLLLNEK